MSRIAYVNGRYMPHRHAAVHIEDRGYQFADGVYEVVLVLNGHLVDCDGHLNRLDNSLKELSIQAPVTRQVLEMILKRMVCLNRIVTGNIYIQITRGVARRDHKFPEQAVPALVMTAKHMKIATGPQAAGAVAVTLADERWARRDIKTVQLLANCLAKQAAAEQGAQEAILIMPDGSVSEGSSSNVWILSENDELITRPASHDILNGITRRTIARIAADFQLKLIERPFDVKEMMAAKEVFITSASALVTSVTKIDDKDINEGRMGRVAAELRAAYIENAEKRLI